MRAASCHSPDLAALDALAAGWQVVHRVDGADGPGVAPPLELAAFAVAPHGLVHLRTRKHTDTHKDAEENKTAEITGRMQSSVAQRNKKKRTCIGIGRALLMHVHKRATCSGCIHGIQHILVDSFFFLFFHFMSRVLSLHLSGWKFLLDGNET